MNQSEQIPAFLQDPHMIELLDIARTLEVSLLQEMNAKEKTCTVTAFYQHDEKDNREILATATGTDMFETTREAVEKAFEVIEAQTKEASDNVAAYLGDDQ